MKKFKKVLLSILSLALVAVLSIGGTLAYLTSQDEDVNVMTMGNVKIAQHEYERAENEDGTYKTDTIDGKTSYVLKEFTQAKPLLPIVGDPSASGKDHAGWDSTIVRMTQVDSYGSMEVFAGKVAQDKFVTVENTGKSDAYIRTLVAIEVGTANPSLVGTSYHNTWSKNENEIVTISANGTKYIVIEYLYNGGKLSDGSWRHKGGVLPAGDTSYPSISQVYLKSTATNEDCEKLDGNKNGALDILVLSQAVQTSGFEDAKTALDKAFGTPAEKAAEWFGGKVIPTVASTAEELKSALEAGKDVILAKDIEINSYLNLTYNGEATLYLNGKNITNTKTGNSPVIFTDSVNTTLNIVGDGNLTGGYGLWAYDGTINVYGGNHTAKGHAAYSTNGTINIYGGTFNNTELPDKFTLNIKDGKPGKINVYGGTYVDYDPANSESENPIANLVVAGYKSVANGDGSYTVVAE